MSRDRGYNMSGPAQSAEVPSGFRFDVVGIGALNLDYIAGTAATAGASREHSLTARISDLVGQEREPLEWGVERQVDSRTIHAVIEAVSSSRPDTMLGGSAFNAIHAIAKTKAGLRLGYVGVAGRVPVIGLSALQQLDSFVPLIGSYRSWMLEFIAVGPQVDAIIHAHQVPGLSADAQVPVSGCTGAPNIE